MTRSTVFAGCVRDCALHLPHVLANCERLAATQEQSFFIFAESDSIDSTKPLLAGWCAARENARLLNFEGLHVNIPKRTERIAFLRNYILQFIREHGLGGYDALCMMDFDEVNAAEIACDGFQDALDFLFESPDRAGVFAVSDPIYYDIYALRHEHWSPGDCWKAFREAPPDRRAEIFQSLICERQVPIENTHVPIEVASAFGGLGLYRLGHALNATYVGLDPAGEEACEHVSFNSDIKQSGGRLFLFPALRNATPWVHCLNGRPQKTMRFGSGARQIELVAPQSHQLDHYLKNYPLYDRRLSLLLSVFNQLFGEASVLDIGANILDTVALMWLSGVRLKKSISVDASLEFYKYAKFNAERNAAYACDAQIIWGFVGADADLGNIAAVNGTGNIRELRRQDHLQTLLQPKSVTFADLAPDGVDLVKTDLDGYDHVVIEQNLNWLRRWKPMLWVEAQIDDGADIGAWSKNFLALAEDFPYVAAFDNFGFCLCSGAMIEKWNVILDLISISARYRSYEATSGSPRFYYLDILFMPRRFAGVFEDFIARLPEARPALASPSLRKQPHHAQAS